LVTETNVRECTDSGSFAVTRSAHSDLFHRDGIDRYLAQIRHFPMLDARLEHELAKRYRDFDDRHAAQQLITSHLRLAAKIALEYRGYGLPLSDLISEANLGILKAAKRFDADRGARFASYATWWIRAQIHEYVLRSRSLVRMGTTAAQKILFFNLRRLKARFGANNGCELLPDQVRLIAAELGVPEAEVVSMNGRLSAVDASLNVPPHDGDGEWQDSIADDADDQEAQLAEREVKETQRLLVHHALMCLTNRERKVVVARHLRDEPVPLVLIADHYGVTAERIRQIEMRALTKLRKLVQAASLVTLRRAA
jgi:RNA polymerase sigma-32 factor